MRKLEREAVTKFEYVDKEITCNKCGIHHETTGLPNDYNTNKFQDIVLHFGYGSKFDGESISFDLCDSCIEDLIKSFKHVPDGLESRQGELYMSQEEFEEYKIK